MWNYSRFCRAGWIHFISLLMNVMLNSTVTEGSCTTLNMMQVLNLYIKRWNVIVPASFNLLSDSFRISRMPHWLILYRELGSNTSAHMGFGSAWTSKTQTWVHTLLIGSNSHGDLGVFLLKNDNSRASVKAGMSWRDLSGLFLKILVSIFAESHAFSSSVISAFLFFAKICACLSVLISAFTSSLVFLLVYIYKVATM